MAPGDEPVPGTVLTDDPWARAGPVPDTGPRRRPGAPPADDGRDGRRGRDRCDG